MGTGTGARCRANGDKPAIRPAPVHKLRVVPERSADLSTGVVFFRSYEACGPSRPRDCGTMRARPFSSETLPVTDSALIPLPDHLAVDPRSPYHVAAVFQQQADIGIRFNGKERFDVEEYCVSEGWIKVPAGKTLDRRGRPLLITLKGSVEAFYK